MRVTIAIATYNRADELRLTLESLSRIDGQDLEDWEILIVGNRCTDNTAAVAKSMAAAFGGRLRYVEEPRPGLSHARNRAVAESRFEVIAFLDDDVNVDRKWLNALASAYREENCAAVGGRAYLVYPGSRPRWLGDDIEGLLTKVECGSERRTATADELYGVNLSFRRDWIDRVGVFRADLGRVGTRLIGDEERELLERVTQAGGQLIYEPAAVVGHRVPTSRLQRRWFWSRSFWGGLGSSQLISAEELSFRSLLRPSLHIVRRTYYFVRECLRHGYASPEAFAQAARGVGYLGTWIGLARRLLHRLCGRGRTEPAPTQDLQATICAADARS
jgi:glycosyltransferase involved in cell wall biosynthesis